MLGLKRSNVCGGGRSSSDEDHHQSSSSSSSSEELLLLSESAVSARRRDSQYSPLLMVLVLMLVVVILTAGRRVVSLDHHGYRRGGDERLPHLWREQQDGPTRPKVPRSRGTTCGRRSVGNVRNLELHLSALLTLFFFRKCERIKPPRYVRR